MLLYNDENKLVGALCINHDTTRVTSAIRALNEFMPGKDREETGKAAFYG